MTLRRPKNAAVRSREHLTEPEVNQLIAAARERGRHGHRDATAILVSYRHGLRVSELCDLRWSQVDFLARQVYVRRVKNGKASLQDLGRSEIDELKKVRFQQDLDRTTARLRGDERSTSADHVFVTERGGPMTPSGFTRMLKRTAESIEFHLKVHPHMLRHACGFKLANDGRDTRAIQDYLGHRQIAHTVRYTELTADRFRGFWSD